MRQLNEKEYENIENKNIRLLGLFRYWNMINYFYPLKNHMDESWDKVLYESIPKFRSADTKEDYHKTIYWLTNKLRDTHTSYPPTVDNVVFGKYRPNFRLLNINDTIIINKIRDTSTYTDDFQIGDIILKIENSNALELYDSLQLYVCGGNYWSNQSFACNAILSRYDSVSTITVLRGCDTLVLKSTNQTARNLYKAKQKKIKDKAKQDLFHWISDSVAYLNLESATDKNFKKNYKAVKNASILILDLRCYPSTKIVAEISDFFVPPSPLFAYVTYADSRFPGMLRFHKSSNEVGDKNYYKGKIIVLVNEETKSYSEYITMLLQANPNTFTVGNSTSGADGNVSTLIFPGNVKTLYTGIGIYYPDMTPTQRKGVNIDYIVEPTIESIRNNVDLAYEKAIEMSSK